MKNDVLENARAHFKKQLDGEMKSLEVPEWKTTIYWKPLTAKQKEKITSLWYADKLVEASIEQIITRALDEDGKRIFSPGDQSIFKNAIDPEIIDRISLAMTQSNFNEDGEVVKE